MRISVYHGLVLYIHSLARVLERIEALLIIGLSGTDTGNHIGIGVPAQAILKDSSKLRVPIRDKLRLFLFNCCQSRDHITELEQA